MVDLLDAAGMLRLYGSYVDETGRAQSPYIQRGSNNVPRTIPRMPTHSQIRNMDHRNPDDVEALSMVLYRFGLTNTPTEGIANHAKYLDRFRGLTSDDPNFTIEKLRLAEADSGRALLGQARRITQRWETLENIGGNPDQVCIYINEGDDPCEECLPLGGEEAPYSWFVTNGNLPGDRCLGGDLCQCSLTPIEEV